MPGMDKPFNKLFAPVPRDLHQRVKILAIRQERSMQEVVADAVAEYVARHDGKAERAKERAS